MIWLVMKFNSIDEKLIYLYNTIYQSKFVQMTETNEYWISDDKFIFKPDFNKPLGGYLHIIANYNHLIFSNYNDLEIMIKTNNHNDSKHNKTPSIKKLTKSSFFNRLTNCLYPQSINEKIRLLVTK